MNPGVVELLLTRREPIVLTGSKDANMLLGELDAQDFS